MTQRTVSVPGAATDLYELLIAYAKQETTVPLQQLGRVIALGLAGAILMGLGGMFITVGGLRLLQEETTVPDWLPYLIMMVVLLLVGATVWKLGTRRKQKREVLA